MEMTGTNENREGIDLTSGKSFGEFIGTSEDGNFVRRRVGEIQFSPSFEKALGEFGKTTLVVFADMTCPDCRAVLPFLGKIGEVNAGIEVVFGEWNAASEGFLQRRLGTGRVPTVLALDASGRLMDGAFIERPLAVHRATAEAASRRDAMLAIGKFRNGGDNDLIEEDLLKVLRGEKNDVLPYLK
ncbi:MAG: thioredoxin family protein [Synergistaceae bacterium]|jgi:thiol-disulfide isomerase/thioredoxin|nr:thioredoxin family protein [Synergistaceae bacterium]